MALKRIIPGGFVANRCSPARWFTSPSLIALGFIQSSQGSAPAVPSAPTGLALSIITGAVRLDWNAVSGATSYNIYRSLAGGGGTLYQSGVTDIFFEDTSVLSGQSYYYEVTAVNGVGESSRSTEEGITPSEPANITGFAVAATGASTINLEWDTDTGVSWAAEWQLAGGDWSSLVGSESPISVNSYQIQSLTPGTSYDVRIRASNTFGFSAWAELDAVSTLMETPEVTSVITLSDVGANRHGKYFLLSSSTQRVSLTMDAGLVKQRMHFNFQLASGASLVTNGSGYCILIDAGFGLDCYWFNTGSESAPGITAHAFYEVTIGPFDTSDVVAGAWSAIAATHGFSIIGSSGYEYDLMNDTGGVMTAPDLSSMYGITVDVTTTGQAAAVDPAVADRNIMVAYSDNTADTDLATAIYNAVNSDGAWFAQIVGGNNVIITDMASGARLDAVDVDTGFTISIIQQGGGTALTIDNDTLDLVFAWSVARRLRTLHTASLARLRDSTTTTEGDVGYDGGNLLDTAARDAIIGAHDATLPKIYDQSPNGFDVSQATAGLQFAIKTGGTVQEINGKQGALAVGASANVMHTGSVAHGIGTNDFCLSAIIKTDSSLASWESLLGLGSNAPGVYLNRGTTAGFFWGADYLFATTLATNTVYVLTFMRQSGVYKLYVNGTLDANTPAILFSNITDGDIHLMSDSGSSDYGGGILLEAIMWKRIPANLAAIIADQRALAGV